MTLENMLNVQKNMQLAYKHFHLLCVKAMKSDDSSLAACSFNIPVLLSSRHCDYATINIQMKSCVGVYCLFATTEELS
jgi:hypothetical protein